jgi:hypothetical protein
VLNVTHQNIVWRKLVEHDGHRGRRSFPGAAIVIWPVPASHRGCEAPGGGATRLSFTAAGALAMWLLALGPEPTLAGTAHRAVRALQC